MQDLRISNPKRRSDHKSSLERKLFPYYAGYSHAFAYDLLKSYGLKKNATVVDPWNGSGTTTTAAMDLGLRAIGFDLNPAMVVVARAQILPSSEALSIPHLARSIISQANKKPTLPIDDNSEGITRWLIPSSASSLRHLEREINRTLVSFDDYKPLKTRTVLNELSSIAAFLYLALFKTARRLIASFIPTNPTWVKIPKSANLRKRPSKELIQTLFLEEIDGMTAQLLASSSIDLQSNDIRISLGNAEDLPLTAKSIDAIVTSPPYCTRIDYAVATSIELSVLGLSPTEFDDLRRTLTGTSTVATKIDTPQASWGGTCLNFLEAMYSHPSKASQGYYFKNHVQYFSSLFQSVGEVERVLKKKGVAALVVQDSRYKEIHNDVATIVTEMAQHHGLNLVQRVDFGFNQSMALINGAAKKYRADRSCIESVLCFQAN